MYCILLSLFAHHDSSQVENKRNDLLKIFETNKRREGSWTAVKRHESAASQEGRESIMYYECNKI